MHNCNKRKSLKDLMEAKKRVLHPYSARKERRKTNYEINYSYLRQFNLENNLGIEDVKLREMAYRFHLWEKHFVFSFSSGYEEFRDKVIWLDYDEILEMCMEITVHPTAKQYWRKDEIHSYFIDTILPQMNNLI